MKRATKIISIVLILIMTGTLFSSCKKSAAGKNIWFPIEGNLNTLDPQCAGTADELLVIQNTMEGLVRKDLNGQIVPGIAEKWTISEDGLTYTFQLKKNAKWDLTKTQEKLYKEKDYTGESPTGDATIAGTEFDAAITAHDFVFALQRACLPNTDAPYFNSISAIQGAVSIHNGQVDAGTLAVTATDDYTLQIVLTQPDEQFLGTLTTAIAMPCSQAYFTFTKGRYGLEKNYILVNGPFYLSGWEKNGLVLKKSDLYTEKKLTLPDAVTLRVPEDRTSVLPNFLKGTYDVAILSGSESQSITDKDGVTLTPFESTVWSYLFNSTDDMMSNENLRKALCYAFQPVDATGAAHLSAPNGIAPGSCNINGKAYREYTGKAPMIEHDETAAVQAWMAALKELSPSKLDIAILCTEDMASYVKQSVQGLQKTLGNKVNYVDKNNSDAGLALSFKIETTTQADFNDRLKTGDYQIAFCPLTATDDNVLNFFKQFQIGNGNLHYESASYDKLISQAEETRDAQMEASLLRQCEEELLGQAVVLPVLSESSYFAMAKGVSDIGFATSGGRVNFVYGKRQD